MLSHSISAVHDYSQNALHKAALIESSSVLKNAETEGKVVAIIALGNDLAKLDLYQYLIAVTGIRALIIESEGNPVLESLLANDSDFAIPVTVSLESRPSLVDDVVGAINSTLRARHLGLLDGVITYWDDAVGLAVRVAHACGLEDNPIASIDLAHDKGASRQWLAQRGFPSPQSFVIRCIADIKEHVDLLSFPVILKPVFGAASIGVVKVATRDALVAKYLDVVSILETSYREHELMGLTFHQGGGSSLMDVVVEEFLSGREYDCDVVVQDGRVLWSELCDDWEYAEHHFVELGSSVPTTAPDARARVIKDYAERVLLGMGFSGGVHHVEVIDDARKGPVLVEVNPRMGGGPVRMNHLMVHRVDLAVVALQHALGIDVAAEVQRKSENWRRHSSATACLYSARSGTLRTATQQLLDRVIARTRDNVIVATSSSEAGDYIRGTDDRFKHPTSLGILSISLPDSVHEVKRKVNLLRDEFLELVYEHLDQVEESTT
eukprot:GHVH01003786.1.p1 GENE.GHVH01003786.1~~GHVH01003786.1.p1  ORF type:complete len:494 (-),score=86.12 GHVH01003786.1:494-1975(-)